MTPDAQERFNVYREGQIAYNANTPCPYIVGHWKFKTWHKGYEAARSHGLEQTTAEKQSPAKDARKEAVAWADAYASNAALPTYTELARALNFLHHQAAFALPVNNAARIQAERHLESLQDLLPRI